MEEATSRIVVLGLSGVVRECVNGEEDKRKRKRRRGPIGFGIEVCM